MSGWIKLHRSLLEWEWWDDHNATRLLTYLLCAVNYERKKWQGIVVEPGTLITSFEKISDNTGLTVKQVRSAMKKLEDCGEVARKRARKGQAITLTKWEKLQSNELEEGKQMDTLRARRGQEEGKKRATTKESKEYKESKEVEEVREIPPLENFSDFAVLPLSEIEIELKTGFTKKENRMREIKRIHGVQISSAEHDRFAELWVSKLRGRGEKHKSRKDAHSHFFNWLDKDLERQKKSPQNSKNKDKVDYSQLNYEE